MSKETTKQNRMQSRRAASKEALKQMHNLLTDSKYEISSDDDEVIVVDPQPPKKKYKLSHRKSSNGNDRDVIVLKTIVPPPVDECPFDLEVVVEELSTTQKNRYELLKQEQADIDNKVKELMEHSNAEVVFNGVLTTAVQITEQFPPLLNAPSTSQFTTPTQGIVLQQQTSANSTVSQSYQLVMDPRLGVIVGAVSTPSTTTTTPLLYQPTVTAQATATPEQPMKTRRGTIVKQMSQLQEASIVQKKATTTAKHVGQKGVQMQVRPVLTKAQFIDKTTLSKATPQKTLPPIKPRIPTTMSTSQAPNYRPTENNVEGGLNMGKTTTTKSIDLTGDDSKNAADSREVSFNKLQGRTYPSLVVVARPHLRVKDLAADRGKLDVKVKSVLMYPPQKFTEWLIQQGLVRSDQKCSNHPNKPLKLGMYSDAAKFPYSGGYVWISECCPQRFVSVFSGSIFEGSQHPPVAILKLLYHWCCQTIVQNVTQWVKVDNLYVKGMYSWFRAVSTVALHTHIKQLGGPGIKVQVGVISLGTTSQDGNKREVKVEVLGILESTTRHIRLKAVEPLADGERNYKKRFSKILEPVFRWVHPQSIIVTDLTVDKTTLQQMGFAHVAQSTSSDYAQSNRTIMEYLRRIVPRMFQNTLSLLSRQIIQQFLDELVWREWYGTTVLQCFDNMVLHMSEQTRSDSGPLILRLGKVMSNPFKNWAISTNTAPKSVPSEDTTPKRYNRQRKPLAVTQPTPPRAELDALSRPTKSTSPDVPEQMVPLENYYYGTINSLNQTKNKIAICIKCPFCKMTFTTNISLMNHLFKHAHNVSNDVQLCRYCLTIVPSGQDLLKHIDTSHPGETKFDNGFVCLICESHFRNPFILGKHMSKEHCPSELPYICGTCNFRCSNHKVAVDHFYSAHDHGTTIQCPFCLKSTTVVSSGRNITQNINYFIQHLQKHQRKYLAKRCGRCTLWFIQKEFLKDHQIKMHVSQRGKPGLVPCFAPRNGVMVPKSRMDKCPDETKVINFTTLHFNIGPKLNCKECDKPLNTSKHFVSFENCQNSNCQFATCCAIAMQEHTLKCKSSNYELPMEKLPYEMFCICGFCDISGNKMAKHLAICERKTAYPSTDAAKEATVTHSMLDVLGLVRKPDEHASKEPEPELVLKKTEPLILKRGRPKKNPDGVVAKKNDKINHQLSITNVVGGVNIIKDNTSKHKVQSIDLTDNEENATSKKPKFDEDIVQVLDDDEIKGEKEVEQIETKRKTVEQTRESTKQAQDPNSTEVTEQTSEFAVITNENMTREETLKDILDVDKVVNEDLTETSDSVNNLDEHKSVVVEEENKNVEKERPKDVVEDEDPLIEGVENEAHEVLEEEQPKHQFINAEEQKSSATLPEKETLSDEIKEEKSIEEPKASDEIHEEEKLSDEIKEEELIEEAPEERKSSGELAEEEKSSDEILEEEKLSDEIKEEKLIEEAPEESKSRGELAEEEKSSDELAEEEKSSDEILEEEKLSDEIKEEKLIEEAPEERKSSDELAEEEKSIDEILEGEKSSDEIKGAKSISEALEELKSSYETLEAKKSADEALVELRSCNETPKEEKSSDVLAELDKLDDELSEEEKSRVEILEEDKSSVDLKVENLSIEEPEEQLKSIDETLKGEKSTEETSEERKPCEETIGSDLDLCLFETEKMEVDSSEFHSENVSVLSSGIDDSNKNIDEVFCPMDTD